MNIINEQKSKYTNNFKILGKYEDSRIDYNYYVMYLINTQYRTFSFYTYEEAKTLYNSLIDIE